MGLLDRFRDSQPSSASVAKERLQIIVAHERNQRNQPSYLPQLQSELVEVVRKYVNIEMDDINIDLQHQDLTSVLELNITLPSD